MKALLEIDSVRKSFESRNILSDISLQCRHGDIIGILGRNGTGKSTLLQIIYGVMPAEHKFIRINGKVRNRAFKHKNEIAYLPQDNFIPSHFTVKQAIDLFIDPLNKKDFMNDDFIQKLTKNRISEISGGEQRYLEIKLILWKNAGFVLLDEPYNGIAPVLIDRVNELIAQKSKEKGILLTDHNYRCLLQVVNRLYLLKDQFLKELNSKDELVSNGYLKEGML